MAQNSISRLAIHIVTDTKGMSAGFAVAQTQTKQFAAQTETLGNKVRASAFNQGEFTKKLIENSQAFGRAAPLINTFAGSGGSLALVAAGSLAAGAAVLKFSDAMGKLADRVGDERIDRMRSMFAEFGRPELAKGMETSAESMKRFSTAWGEAAERLGLSSVEIKKSAANLAFYASGLGLVARLVESTPWGQEGKRLQDAAKASEGFMRRQLEAGKVLREQRAANAKAIDEEVRSMQSAMERSVQTLSSRGKSLTEALRTPEEIFRDQLKELRQLADGGYIAGETMSRGAAKAADEFRRATSEAKRLRSEVRGVSAVEQTSRDFRSTFMTNNARSNTESAAEKDAAATLKRMETVLRSIDSKPAVTFKKGAL